MGGMKYVGAYLLDALSGNSPSEGSIKTILEAAGVEIEADLLALVVKKCAGKSVEQIMSAGLANLEQCGGGGGGGGAAEASAGGDAAGAGAPAEKKEEAAAEEEEEEMDFDLFG